MEAMTMLEAERERLALRGWRMGNTEAWGCDAAAGGAALRVFGKLFQTCNVMLKSMTIISSVLLQVVQFQSLVHAGVRKSGDPPSQKQPHIKREAYLLKAVTEPRYKQPITATIKQLKECAWSGKSRVGCTWLR